ncbi:hypothetical protein [Paenibacillus sacheonensis]|uniref:CDP-Glycerol:Poly(Glycerophosphate) glycerophosphotransferase n=1 Tax=Paenibacillus sacheonensis TaxID=742054 RepID=A0A7X4YV86_9BACL|nr:hypothetical protein [Paenibacillus sacheonensis]MBM7566467.1 hypothetical protein [Paenibacillus sacheonensis]NBC73150.1 hypothetical protein [Paenibacillus sacheonensis]
MRKYHQEKVLELIKTLSEAQRELARLKAEQNTRAFIGLLADCQDFALHVGQYIDKFEGEGTRTVSLLEKYCDILYYASVGADKGEDNTPHIDALQEQLREIEGSVKTELKQSKIEIAFLPYKASMWDSCESIWVAAKEDPECDAYVVPIPYFDRLPGGAVGQMHYEGNQFPDDVPITDWQSYNIEERRPDVIVTINPYDDSNLMTMVHPDFFSKRIKDLTEMLVYVPYFVSMDDVDEHFCKCVGVLYADRVIVQSDKIRQTYVRVLQQFERENRCVGMFGNVEEKIVALGSPKFDKVVNTKREDCDVPDEWRKLIERADGTEKKVILYNTSLAALLEGNEKVLSKLRDVIEVFKRREDVVLLWRPHPLSKSAYQSMRPHLREEYERIIEDYKRQQIGIFDDSADLHRAIALSDAYYGDGGSMIALYACTGKPMMAQWLESSTLADGNVLLNTVHDDGEYLWGSTYNFNGLFRVDKSTMIAEYMGIFAEDNVQYLYLDCVERDMKLYFAPYYADYIGIYDKVKHAFGKLEFHHKERLKWLRSGENEFFNRVVHYQQYLFFVPHMYPAIIRYDTESGELTYCSDWVNHVEYAAKKSPHWPKWQQTYDFDGLLCPGGQVVGSEIAINLYVSNELMFFDMQTLTYQFYKIGKQEERYFGVCYDGENYWLAARKGNYVLKWKRETQTYQKIVFSDDVVAESLIHYRALVYSHGYVWLFPNEAGKAFKIDVNNHSIHEASELDLPATRELGYLHVKRNDNTIVALTRNAVLQWDMMNHQHKLQSISFADQDYDTIMKLKFTATSKQLSKVQNVFSAIYTDNFVGLNTFLDYITRFNLFPFTRPRVEKQLNHCREMTSNLDGTAGQAIHTFNKQSLLTATGGKR